MSQIDLAWGEGPSARYERLAENFRPIFAEIAAGAITREINRDLPVEAIAKLKAARFGALRVPEEEGGFGATLPELFNLLIELSEADSNITQALRGHFGFVEDVVSKKPGPDRARWTERLARGEIAGNAWTEIGNASQEAFSTRVSEKDGKWSLTGAKYYTTGSLFADWIDVGATNSKGEGVVLQVRRDAPGVDVVDDWDGFGQILTASGTTTFAEAPVDPADVVVDEQKFRYGAAFYQIVHLATLAGIGRAAVADTVRFVGQRGRNLLNPAHPEPGDDPLVQQVVGRIAGASFAADAVTLAAADVVDEVQRAQLAGTATTADFDRADVAAFGAQGQVIDLVLGLVTRLFEVGGASAVRERHRLDRHWRNARTLASHNPAVYRDRTVGDFVLNGTSPSAVLAASWADVQRLRPTPEGAPA